MPWVLRQQRHNLRSFLRSGVTTIRDMGAPFNLIRVFASLARAGRIASPRILFAGPVVSVAGGYPYFVPPTPAVLKLTLGPIVHEVLSEGHLNEVVSSIASNGVSCIKVTIQAAKYDDDRTPIPTMPRPWRRALVKEAKRFDLPVAAHHIYVGDLVEDIDIPYGSLEHLPIDGVIPDDIAERIGARKTPVSTTLMTYGLIDHLDELRALVERPEGRFERVPAEFLSRAVGAMESDAEVTEHIGRKVIDTGSVHMRENLAKLHAAGAVIVNGTDSGGAITPPGNPHWELMDMVRAGLSNLEALRTATTAAADVLGRADLGRIIEGNVADIVLLDANPLDDISAVAKVVAVVQRGRLAHVV